MEDDAKIKAAALKDLEIIDCSLRHDVVAEPADLPAHDWWGDLTVDRNDVLKLWHEIPSLPSVPIPALTKPTLLGMSTLETWVKPIVDRIAADGRG